MARIYIISGIIILFSSMLTVNGTSTPKPPFPYIPKVNCTFENDTSSNCGRSLPPLSKNHVIYMNMYLYGLPIIILLGTIGNSITSLVLCQRTMRTTGTYFYMAVLSVADSVVLYFNALRKWIFMLSGFDLNLVSDAGCKITSFLNYWTFDFATWIVVAMTIDRFLAVHSPLRAISISTIDRIKKVLVIIGILDAGLNMHFFWTMELNDNRCKAKQEYEYFHYNIWPVVDAIMYSFLPFFALLVFNIIIVSDMFAARQIRQNLYANANTNGDHSRSPVRNRRRNHLTTSSWHLTFMLLVVTTIFLVLSAPSCIFLIMRFFLGHQPPNMIAKASTTLLLYLNHSLNFYLYCASGRKFRQTLVSLYKFSRERRRLRTTSSVTQNTRVSFNSLTGRISMVSEQSQA